MKKNPYRTKENLIGRVSCQVKGVDNASVKKQKINYSMERATLENYFNDGGTILFVVRRQESKDPDGKAEFQIYYAELLPIKIQQLLESKSEQDKESKISIACNVFPEKRGDVEWTIKNFYEHKVRNSIFIGKSIDTKYSIENLSTKNNLQAIRVYRSFQKNFLEPRPNREEIIYGVTSICDVEQEIPLHLVESIVLSNQIEEKILINDCEYIMQVNVTDSNCQIVIRFGESFKTILNKETKKQTFRIDLKSQQALKDKIRDLKFIIAACSGNEVVVGGGAHKFIVKELESKQIEDFESQLSMLEKIQNLLDLLGVKNDLELGSVTGVEMKEMNRLYAYFLANEKIRLKTTPENDFEI